MTRQEQIEEMAVIGCVRNPQAHTAEECAKCDFKQGQCNAYRHAEAIYNAGYPNAIYNVKLKDLAYIVEDENGDVTFQHITRVFGTEAEAEKKLEELKNE